MKKLLALVLVALMLLGGCAFAAQWPEGRSAAQPYSRLPEVNLSETMGYILMFPREKVPANRFCDVIGMYLPREDLALGEGLAHLYEKVEGESDPVEVCTVDFSNTDSVTIRDMSEKELQDLMWGGGKCVQMNLPKSLEFGEQAHNYYVLMDAGCFTAADGALESLQITSDEAWIPVIEGDYGVSGLYYLDAELPVETETVVAEDDDDDLEVSTDVGIVDVPVVEEESEEDGEEADEAEDAPEVTEEPEATEEPEPTEEPEETEEAAEDAPLDPSQYVVKPDPGDKVIFDLVIGGDAKMAVFYSDNGSVEFEQIEYDGSAHVEGTVVGTDVQWGVSFFDENDYLFDTLNFSR